MERQNPTYESDARTSASRDRALRRVVAEIVDGLRHGYFDFAVTCEVISQERRRLVLRAGKTHQFLIPKNECMADATPSADSCDRSDTNAD